jgi:hypothetical protein
MKKNKQKRVPILKFGDFLGDFGKQYLSTIVKPMELLTGQEIYDPNYATELGKKLKPIHEKYTDVMGGITNAVGTSALNMAVPGAGTALGSTAKGIGNAFEEKGSTTTNKTRRTANINPYGMFRDGGMLKQYNAPSHEEGGQMLDKNANPTNNPNDAIAEIEKQETSWRNYVFSDTLGDGNNTFAKMSKAIARKYKGRNDDLSLATMEKEMNALMEKNESAKGTMENVPGKYDIGGLLLDFSGINTGDLPYEIDDPNAPNPFIAENVFPNKELPVNNAAPTKTTFPDVKEMIFGNLLGFGKPKTPETSALLPNPNLPYPEKTGEVKSPPVIGKFDAIALGLKGLGLGKSAYDALQPSEQEQLRLNQEANMAKNLMAGRNINMAAVLNDTLYNRNAAMANNQNARSTNVNRALDMQTIAAANRDTMRGKLQEQQLNNQFRGEEAQTRASLGASDAIEQIRRQNVQSQNDAVQRQFGQKFFQDLTEIGTQFNKAQMYKDMLDNKKDLFVNSFRETLSLLNSQGNYKLFNEGEAILDKILKGEQLTTEEWNKAISMMPSK